MRITQRLMVDRVLKNLNAQSRGILKLQEQLSTGHRVNRPSDDPLAVRRAVNAQTENGKNEQFLRNISAAGPALRVMETALQSSIEVVQRANDLTLQAINGTNGQAQRDQIANEINELLEEMVTQGNSTANGRYVFGGTRTLDAPIAVSRSGNQEINGAVYLGNVDEITIEIAEGTTIPVSMEGLTPFFEISATTVNIYQTLINLRDSMRSGNMTALNTELGNIGSAQQQVSVALAKIGAVQNRLERADNTLRSINTQLEQVISDNIDADFAEVTLNLNAQSNAFQAALNAGARVIQPSLLDYVR